MSQDGLVNASLCSLLNQAFSASHIRSAVAHVQDKGQQKVVALIAAPDILPSIPNIFRDHNGENRIIQYKQPEVHVSEQTSNIYVKETRADHHVGAHIKGLHQGARLSGFFPMPANDLSRRRCSQLQLFNLDLGRKDVHRNTLDEFVPMCLVSLELSMQEASQLLNIMLYERNILDHHSIFLTCSIFKPVAYPPESAVVKALPDTECIVHCRLDKGQQLKVLQPRFERGRVSKCINNVLQLTVYDHTNLLLFLPGQVGFMTFLSMRQRAES